MAYVAKGPLAKVLTLGCVVIFKTEIVMIFPHCSANLMNTEFAASFNMSSDG